LAKVATTLFFSGIGAGDSGQNAHREWNFRVQIDRAAEGTVKALGDPTGLLSLSTERTTGTADVELR